MTEQEKQISEQHRGHYTKFSLKTIYAIYDKYNGIEARKDCFCSALYREKMAIEYYQWYDNYNNPQ